MSQSIVDDSDSASSPDPPKFKRIYKACLSCRTRKVKCDLGEVSNPHDPPCLRCKRERKECVFADSKRGGSKSVLIGKRKKEMQLQLEMQQQQMHNQQPQQQQPLPPQQIQQQQQQQQQQVISAQLANDIIDSKRTDTNYNEHLMPNNMMQNYSLNSGLQAPRPSLSVLPPPLPQMSASSASSNSTNITPLIPSSSSSNAPPPLIPLPLNAALKQASQAPSAKGNGAASTIIYLANIAGDIAKADERDRVEASVRYQEIADSNTRSESASSFADDPNVSSGGNSGNTTNRNNSMADTNSNGLPIVGSSSESAMNRSHTDLDSMNKEGVSSNNFKSSAESDPKHLYTPQEYINNKYGINDKSNNFESTYRGNRYEVAPINNPLSVHPKPSKKLIDIEYIGDQPYDILNESQARRLVILFFTSMHPYFPYVPPELHDSDTLSQYPVLLCAILTISARYHPFDEEDEINYYKIRNNTKKQSMHIEIHERMWVYCQRLISQTVWGETSTRSIGTVLAFLLFTEWNPRAIHWRWSDYANSVEQNSNSNEEKEEDSFAGLSALKRSEMMSFMLIGTASRLSYLLEDNPYVFLATHIAETFICINVNRRSMLSQSLNEVDLDYSDSESDFDSNDNKKKLKFDDYQKATLELLQLFQLCYECLYSSKINNNKLSILDIMTPILEKWYRRYHKLLVPSVNQVCTMTKHNNNLLKPNTKYVLDLSEKLKRESLILDYYYIKLYIYSIALDSDELKSSKSTDSRNADTHNGGSSNNGGFTNGINSGNDSLGNGKSESINNNNDNFLKLDKLTKYSKYVEMAYKAAKEVLNVIQRVNKLKLLKYMPVRWTTRVIKAVAFVVKCYLTLSENNKKSNIMNSLMSTSGGGSANGGLSSRSHSSNGNLHSIYINESNQNNAILSLSIIPNEELINIIQKTALALRDATPDELHLCTRYSTILMYLCSQFKSKSNQLRTTFNFDYEEKIKLEDQQIEAAEEQARAEAEARAAEQARAEANARAQMQQQYQQPQYANVPYQGQPPQQQWTRYSASPSGMTPAAQQQVGPEETPQVQGQTQFEIPQISNANQQMFDDFFSEPSDFVFNWFSNNNSTSGGGLDFVDQWTKEIEQDFLQKGNNVR